MVSAPSWLTESGFYAFLQELADVWWAILTFGILLGLIIAIWVTTAIKYKGKKPRIIVSSLLTVFLLLTWGTTMYKLLNGLIWPFVVLFAFWGVLSIRYGKAGFIFGLVFFYFWSIHFYVWPEFWMFAESW